MGVSLKTENEERSGKTMLIRGGEGGRRGFTGTSMQRGDGKFSNSPPSASPVA